MAAVAVAASPEASASNAACQPLLQLLVHERLCENVSMKLERPALLAQSKKAAKTAAELFKAGAAATSVRRYVAEFLRFPSVDACALRPYSFDFCFKCALRPILYA